MVGQMREINTTSSSRTHIGYCSSSWSPEGNSCHRRKFTASATLSAIYFNTRHDSEHHRTDRCVPLDVRIAFHVAPPPAAVVQAGLCGRCASSCTADLVLLCLPVTEHAMPRRYTGSIFRLGTGLAWGRSTSMSHDTLGHRLAHKPNL